MRDLGRVVLYIVLMPLAAVAALRESYRPTVRWWASRGAFVALAVALGILPQVVMDATRKGRTWEPGPDPFEVEAARYRERIWQMYVDAHTGAPYRSYAGAPYRSYAGAPYQGMGQRPVPAYVEEHRRRVGPAERPPKYTYADLLERRRTGYTVTDDELLMAAVREMMAEGGRR